jgi:hypothetical protein
MAKISDSDINVDDTVIPTREQLLARIEELEYPDRVEAYRPQLVDGWSDVIRVRNNETGVFEMYTKCPTEVKITFGDVSGPVDMGKLDDYDSPGEELPSVAEGHVIQVEQTENLKPGDRMWDVAGETSDIHSCRGCYKTPDDPGPQMTLTLVDDSGYHPTSLCRKCLLAAAAMLEPTVSEAK